VSWVDLITYMVSIVRSEEENSVQSPASSVNGHPSATLSRTILHIAYLFNLKLAGYYY